ncbi:hypothetical protein CBR_g54976 [Chara braunii]|uniref:Uncharacterized protein n=1 Tax=Chara braunii TaxID=69332 RepID=A0A388K7I8_CHABU|nr:hypothetical protein CBR_g54976 [Chara braunii]|eukprot:GBG65997.1 hypothetical protein CBR_g54976 [Chara braunii]
MVNEGQREDAEQPLCNGCRRAMAMANEGQREDAKQRLWRMKYKEKTPSNGYGERRTQRRRRAMAMQWLWRTKDREKTQRNGYGERRTERRSRATAMASEGRREEAEQRLCRRNDREKTQSNGYHNGGGRTYRRRRATAMENEEQTEDAEKRLWRTKDREMDTRRRRGTDMVTEGKREGEEKARAKGKDVRWGMSESRPRQTTHLVDDALTLAKGEACGILVFVAWRSLVLVAMSAKVVCRGQVRGRTVVVYEMLEHRDHQPDRDFGFVAADNRFGYRSYEVDANGVLVLILEVGLGYVGDDLRDVSVYVTKKHDDVPNGYVVREEDIVERIVRMLLSPIALEHDGRMTGSWNSWRVRLRVYDWRKVQGLCRAPSNGTQAPAGSAGPQAQETGFHIRVDGSFAMAHDTGEVQARSTLRNLISRPSAGLSSDSIGAKQGGGCTYPYHSPHVPNSRFKDFVSDGIPAGADLSEVVEPLVVEGDVLHADVACLRRFMNFRDSSTLGGSSSAPMQHPESEPSAPIRARIGSRRKRKSTNMVAAYESSDREAFWSNGEVVSPNMACAPHLLRNMLSLEVWDRCSDYLLKSQRVNKEQAKMLLEAARSTSEIVFDYYMQRVADVLKDKNIVEKIFEKADKRHWGGPHFPSPRYGKVTSQVVESMNNRFLKAQRMPPIQLIEEYRGWLQRWHTERRDAADPQVGDHPEVVEDMLAITLQLARKYFIRKAARDVYEVYLNDSQGHERFGDEHDNLGVFGAAVPDFKDLKHAVHENEGLLENEGVPENDWDDNEDDDDEEDSGREDDERDGEGKKDGEGENAAEKADEGGEDDESKDKGDEEERKETNEEQSEENVDSVRERDVEVQPRSSKEDDDEKGKEKVGEAEVVDV